MSDENWGEKSIGYDPEILRRFDARPTDVFVNTTPKAGTTWMQQILHQLRTGGDETFRSIYDVVPWIEFPGKTLSTDERLVAYAALPDPRIFKAHLPYDRTPGVETAKFIIVGRDPRDRCVSAYHHMRNMTDDFLEWLSATKPESFDVFFQKWIERPRYNEHVLSWWKHRTDDNVLWLRYADLKRDLRGAISEIINFLQWHVGNDAIETALSLSSFEWMSKHRDKFTRFSGNEEPSWKPGGFVRKGVVGDHRQTLSGEQEAQILEQSRRTLPSDCLEFLGIK